MGNIRYIMSGINKYGEKKEVTTRELPNEMEKIVFSRLFKVRVINVYKAGLEFVESQEMGEG